MYQIRKDDSGVERVLAEERILVIQLRQIGDILLTTPCLAAIKRERPRAKLTFLSHAMGRLIVDHCPPVDEHFFYGDDWSWRQHLRLARTLRERRFDAVFDFMNNPRSAMLAWATGAPERWAFQSARRLAYTQTVPKATTEDYIVRDKFRLLKAAGFEPTDERLLLPWFETHTRPVMQLYAKEPRFKDAPLRVVLSPTHRRVVRRWPLVEYARLADRLTRDWGALVLWLWGPGEEALVDEARAHCRESTLKAPKTSFREMAALLANVDLFIGNSNGPSHVAVAADTCSLQLHGHTSGRSWCPDTPRHRYVQSPEYGQIAMPRMEAITQDMVWEQLSAMRGTIEDATRAAQERGLRLSWRS